MAIGTALTDVLFVLFHLKDSVTNLALRDFDILSGRTSVVHQPEELSIYDVSLKRLLTLFGQSRHSYQSVFLASNIRHKHVMCGWRQFFEFFARKDIDSRQVNLCVTVLASLRG